MKLIVYITTIFYFLANCSAAGCHNGENKLASTSFVQAKPNENPNVEIKISLTDTTLKSGDKIKLNITLTNTGKTNQRLLFDKPITSNFGPWATSANVIDIKTNKSVLKYRNKAILSSQVYSEEQLKDYYYDLVPNKSIEREYELTDIVVFNSVDNKLPKGRYLVQLFYYNNISNSLIVTIE